MPAAAYRRTGGVMNERPLETGPRATTNHISTSTPALQSGPMAMATTAQKTRERTLTVREE